MNVDALIQRCIKAREIIDKLETKFPELRNQDWQNLKDQIANIKEGLNS